jgi:hypothetical protein
MFRISGEFKNYCVICSHVPTEKKSQRLKDRLYETKAVVHAAPLNEIKKKTRRLQSTTVVNLM